MFAGLAMSVSSTTDLDADVWQNLSLEQDVLLQIFDKLSSTQLVKLSGVSRGWRQSMTTFCNPWQTCNISAAQAKSHSFSLWVKARGNSIKYLSIDSPGQEMPVGADNRNFLLHMGQLNSYRDGAGISVQTLAHLQPSIQHVFATGQVLTPRGIASDKVFIVNLGHLTALKHLQLQIQGQLPVSILDAQVKLAEESLIESLKLTTIPDMRSLVPYPGVFHALVSLHLSVITRQAELEQIMQMLSLVELTFGVNTTDTALDTAQQNDNMDIYHIGNLIKLKKLDLSLLCCYLRNAHMLQRLPDLQQLSISMTDEVGVLFRPEDGSSFGLPSMLSKLQHVELSMHSVFDVTDCLEGLQLIASICSLHVTLQQSSSRGPAEVHWAIKEGSVLARAVCLQNLQIECTSMLIKLLPPKLRSLHVTARKVNVQSDLKVALSMLDVCHLQAKHGVEYF